MSIGPHIPHIQHFQSLTLKIQGQSHEWGGHWKSQHESNILSTHIFLIPCQSVIRFLRYDFFKIWPWKSKVKVMREGNIENHKMGVTSYRLIYPFRSMSIGLSIPEIQHFQNLTLKIQGHGQIAMTLHNYRSRQFHRTSNAKNPSSGFRDMGAAKSGTNLWQIWQVFGPWASPYGANNYDVAQLQVYTSPWNFKCGKSVQQFQRYAFHKVWTQFVASLTTFWSLGKLIWVKWANNHDSAQLKA